MGWLLLDSRMDVMACIIYHTVVYEYNTTLAHVMIELHAITCHGGKQRVEDRDVKNIDTSPYELRKLTVKNGGKTAVWRVCSVSRQLVSC
jgi:hypothetical protein